MPGPCLRWQAREGVASTFVQVSRNMKGTPRKLMLAAVINLVCVQSAHNVHSVCCDNQQVYIHDLMIERNKAPLYK